MKAYQIEAAKVIVEGKTEVGDRAARFGAVKTGAQDIFQTERGNSDVGIVEDIANIVQNKRCGQSTRIYQNNNNGK